MQKQHTDLRHIPSSTVARRAKEVLDEHKQEIPDKLAKALEEAISVSAGRLNRSRTEESRTYWRGSLDTLRHLFNEVISSGHGESNNGGHPAGA